MKEDGSFYKGKVRQRVVSHLKIGVGMDEETGYDAARKVPDLSKIRIVKEWTNCLDSTIDHGVCQLQPIL